MTENKIFDIVLLLALPASGKSEVRKYLRHLSDTKRARDFHMGDTVQLDDFPYVHLMRQIDIVLKKMGQPYFFYFSPERPFLDNREWGTLILMLNEDYDNLVHKRMIQVPSAAEYFMNRIENAARKVGLPARLSTLNNDIKKQLADALEGECAEMLAYQNKQQQIDLKGKTLVIEFARGGPDGANMPLSDGHGYQYSLSLLSKEILAKSVIAYIWVAPAESRRKNSDRADPNNPGSILHHSVPLEVMMVNYGCDDIAWLEKTSKKPGTITIAADGQTFHLPIAKFDNRSDKTSFLRGAANTWPKEATAALHRELQKTCATLFSNFQK